MRNQDPLGSLDHASDEELLVRVQEQDESALSALYERYARLVYSIALHILQDEGQAEETTQEVFCACGGTRAAISQAAAKYLPGSRASRTTGR